MLILACVCGVMSACSPEQVSKENFYEKRSLQADLSKMDQGEPIIMEETAYSPWPRETLTDFPQLRENGLYDLRFSDLSGLDLRDKSEELQMAGFDTGTVWPKELPEGFDPEKIIEEGRNPGLGIRRLHERGITGAGVGIAIVDQPLMVQHEEYRDRLKLYELYKEQGREVAVHGPAVASFAVGKDIGTAPGADLYYISSTFGTFHPDGSYETDLSVMAETILRVLEINRHLPERKKIRVLSISKGFDPSEKGYQEVYDAVEQAKVEGLFVITPSSEQNYPFILMGLDREREQDPEDSRSYRPGLFFADNFFSETYRAFFSRQTMIYVPMDDRTYASFTGPEDYAYDRGGGLSWACPWLAGMYALCLQVDPDLTPERFIEIAKKTGDTNEITHQGKTYSLGKIISPEKLIAALEAGE